MKNNMTEGNEFKTIVRFAIPLLIGNIFQQVYNFADAVLVGRFIGPDALAAVGASGTTVALIVLLIFGFTAGASVLLSQAYGRGAPDEICRIVSGMYFIVSVMSVVLSIAGLLSSRLILMVMHTPDVLMDEAVIYLKIMFAGVLAVAIYNAGSALVRSMGDSVVPLVTLIIASVVNIVLDLVFICVFHMGVAGTAYATVISQIMNAILILVYIILKRKKLLLGGFRPGIPDKEIMLKIIRMGIPTSFQSSVISLGTMCVQGLVNSYGPVVMAAYTAGNKIDLIAIQFVVAIGMSVSVFAGQNIGAGRTDRIKRVIGKVIKLQIAVCSTMAVFIVLFRKQLLMLFLAAASDEAVVIGGRYITIIAIAYVSAGIMQSFLNVLKGAGDVDFSMKVGMIEVATRLVFAYILSYLSDRPEGIFLATPIAWITACICTVIRYKKGYWETGRKI